MQDVCKIDYCILVRMQLYTSMAYVYFSFSPLLWLCIFWLPFLITNCICTHISSPMIFFFLVFFFPVLRRLTFQSANMFWSIGKMERYGRNVVLEITWSTIKCRKIAKLNSVNQRKGDLYVPFFPCET